MNKVCLLGIISSFRSMSERSSGNERGQMAIFIALIFQVLFVFFAMVVNIGLVVHDKINLQNAADLAAYYGAQRQGELLNEIAHINYQIRQDFKLLTFRLRVLGAYGNDWHPASAFSNINQNGQTLEDTVLLAGGQSTIAKSDETGVCIAHPGWLESRQAAPNQSVCRSANFNIPPIPPPVIVAPFNGFNFQIAANINQLIANFQAGCANQGQLNWYFAAIMYAGFKQSVSVRKQMIEQIAAELSGSDPSDFKDHRQASVRQGVVTTLQNNLTSSNLGTLNSSDIVTLNSMGISPCSSAKEWLSEISINPFFMYTDLSINPAGGCSGSTKSLNNLPTNQGLLPTLDPDGSLRNLAQFSDAQPTDNPLHSSLGFEKNPWCLAWYGVKATTHPQKPFAPFGQPVTLTARSFASPFGGRIGPWYGASWQNGALMSSGNRVDPLTPPREPLSVAIDPNDLAIQRIPNYSRFPGDPYGMKSMLALGAARVFLWGTLTGNGAPALRLMDYAQLPQIPVTGDTLAWNSDTSQPGYVRNLEMAAVAPDLFDATYYSVESTYPQNYYGFDAGQRFQNIHAIGDVGSRIDLPNYQTINVQSQIQMANDPNQRLIDLTGTYWVLRDFRHLLTGWTAYSATDYLTFPSNRFGLCSIPALATFATTGGCAQGGRVGYSIRGVSKDFLLYQQHALGGASGATGPLLNPPPSDW